MKFFGKGLFDFRFTSLTACLFLLFFPSTLILPISHNVSLSVKSAFATEAPAPAGREAAKAEEGKKEGEKKKGENKCSKPEMELGYYPYSYTAVKTLNDWIILNLNFWCRLIGKPFLPFLFPLFRLSFGIAQNRCCMFTCWCRCRSLCG